MTYSQLSYDDFLLRYKERKNSDVINQLLNNNSVFIQLYNCITSIYSNKDIHMLDKHHILEYIFILVGKNLKLCIYKIPDDFFLVKVGLNLKMDHYIQCEYKENLYKFVYDKSKDIPKYFVCDQTDGIKDLLKNYMDGKIDI